MKIFDGNIGKIDFIYSPGNQSIVKKNNTRYKAVGESFGKCLCFSRRFLRVMALTGMIFVGASALFIPFMASKKFNNTIRILIKEVQYKKAVNVHYFPINKSFAARFSYHVLDEDIGSDIKEALKT